VIVAIARGGRIPPGSSISNAAGSVNLMERSFPQAGSYAAPSGQSVETVGIPDSWDAHSGAGHGPATHAGTGLKIRPGARAMIASLMRRQAAEARGGKPSRYGQWLVRSFKWQDCERAGKARSRLGARRHVDSQ
jgi:hypothetical protein